MKRAIPALAACIFVSRCAQVCSSTVDLSELRIRLQRHDAVVSPEDPRYVNASRLRNERFDGSIHPLAIVYCVSEQDVVISLEFATQRRIPLTIRSGGHSFAGYSLKSDSLCIDLSQMNSISVNNATGIITAQPGVLNRKLFDTLAAESPQYFLPNGGCDTVGLGGFVQGGGWGSGMRSVGLVCDHLLAARMVLSNGTKIIADNENNHPDLFWALCGGGGGNYGVVVEYTLQAQPLPSDVVLTVTVQVPMSQASTLFELYQDALLDKNPAMRPFEFSISTQLTAHSLQMIFSGTWLGHTKEGREALRPFLEIQGSESVLKEVPFREAVGYPVNSTFDLGPNYWHSGVATQRLPQQFLDEWLWFVEHSPSDSLSIALESLGGAISDIPDGMTAYHPRSGFMQVTCVGTYSLGASESSRRDAYDWSMRAWHRLRRWLPGTYVNDVDDSLLDGEWQTRYYGPNYERLQYLKSKYDPENIFNSPQSICLPAGSSDQNALHGELLLLM